MSEEFSIIKPKDNRWISGWPWCAQCDKPCDEIQHDVDFTRFAEIWRVRCHGATEEAVLLRKTVVEVDGIWFAKAFDKGAPAVRQLPAPGGSGGQAPSYRLIMRQGLPAAILCVRCGLMSNHPDDVAQKYCGKCRQFHAEV